MGRTQLALMYSPNITPDAAWRRLRDWINRYPGLDSKLRNTGYDGRQRIFTAEQLQLIFGAIGEP